MKLIKLIIENYRTVSTLIHYFRTGGLIETASATMRGNSSRPLRINLFNGACMQEVAGNLTAENIYVTGFVPILRDFMASVVVSLVSSGFFRGTCTFGL